MFCDIFLRIQVLCAVFSTSPQVWRAFKHWCFDYLNTQPMNCVCFGITYTKIGTIQRRLAWPLRKDDTQIREAFQIFLACKCLKNI